MGLSFDFRKTARPPRGHAEHSHATGRVREKTISQIKSLLDEFTEICHAVSILGEETARIADAIVPTANG